ncbi:MFS transporter [Cytophaga hutchinsonii]|uniref:MFS transporter n=1 Tax=Cytophaga hutchinsonii (strain ATCC 33406 / DSM 1761 / CIP 103989 / NBRC 15051 / NCIMB 9469 / D465) TaxID=269798 RepID=A0A6N4SNN6_CYTH3|nr:MFS transporter [Cytophaga hutchinsonii]ABG57880.1 conserved hypothetical protein; possible permease [Cytophaga hutchinsonii ATCC 33406]SFX08028.1 Major Facilitator Superfamily protein [Cytophaga hutchinsonii ATCC 33406]
MNRTILLIIAFLAIFAESLLAPYYPMYFAKVFDIHDSNTVGWYIGSCRIVFMAAYPIWAVISKRYSLGSILICTQGMAGVICIACAYSTSYAVFFALSLVMIFFKASYLLIYPHLIQNSSSRYKEIGVLGIILNAGMICSTLASSIWMEQFQIQYIFLIIAAFDFLQMIFSYYFLSADIRSVVSEKTAHAEPAVPVFSLVRIGLLTLFLYLLSTTLRPFYTEFILGQTRYAHTILEAGCLFILPSLSVILFYFIFRKENFSRSDMTILVVAGCFALSVYVQQFETPFILICFIRIVYGFLLFYLCVYLDLLFFESVSSAHVAVWYAFIHVIQNIAYLTAPLYVGYKIGVNGLDAQFDIAFVCALLFLSILTVTSISFKRKTHRYESFR